MKEIINVLPKLQEMVRQRETSGRPEGITICDSTDLARLAGLDTDSHVATLPTRLQAVIKEGGIVLIDSHGNLATIPSNGNAKQ